MRWVWHSQELAAKSTARSSAGPSAVIQIDLNQRLLTRFAPMLSTRRAAVNIVA